MKVEGRSSLPRATMCTGGCGQAAARHTSHPQQFHQKIPKGFQILEEICREILSDLAGWPV